MKAFFTALPDYLKQLVKQLWCPHNAIKRKALTKYVVSMCCLDCGKVFGLYYNDSGLSHRKKFKKKV